MGDILTYFAEGKKRAMSLGNRGPLNVNPDGTIADDILEQYNRYGFYILEGLVSPTELDEIHQDVKHLFERAPVDSGSNLDSQGRPAITTEFERSTFQFAKPLSDPMGGTNAAHGRYPVKMSELKACDDAPNEVILQVNGNLQMMDSCLRLYGHPQLLQLAEAVNCSDFTPFTDALWVKEPGLGAAVAWHQDGWTHWQNPDLDRDTHGFNFMAQLYKTTPANALWVVPESHDSGKIDIKSVIEENHQSDQLPGAVPMLCEAGDVAICNRQILHCSFPNNSPDPRTTFVFGFHRRASVLNAKGWDFMSKKPTRYDAERIHQRSRIITLAIDARQQRFPDEPRYNYQPLAGQEEENRFNAETRQSLLKNYNQTDLGI